MAVYPSPERGAIPDDGPRLIAFISASGLRLQHVALTEHEGTEAAELAAAVRPFLELADAAIRRLGKGAAA